jgi:peroxiredoxin (alkyl hydroperoxide reductase subunit C)
MSTLVTKEAPAFTATAVMADDSFTSDFALTSLRGKYVVLFFYPLDFTFVCPSEILAFNERFDEFQQRDCEIVGVSVDSHYTHLAWRKTSPENGGIGRIQYPLVSDLDKKIARNFGVLHQDAVALRGLFLLDRQGIIRHAVVNDLPLGRSVDEALRVLDALRFHETRGEVCPANWEEGQAGMKPTAEGVAEYLSKYIN